ncbi:sentrin-specific protease 1-like [Pocillopora damicornis]|uniref:sentrin-specific protease 1-like n=1 Tax=Pocillopora damicornis TaxID=46731 RepID=UPI000F551373|nr:sentrin-specific protease 1-like [Pocillopora damicornis]
MLASLSSFYENIRSYSFSGRKAGDKRRREREDEDVIITDVLQTPPAKRLRNLEGASGENSDNSPLHSFSDFVQKVKTWSGRYIWRYVVKGDNQDVTNTSLSRDLNEAENEIMEKQTSSAYTRPISSICTDNLGQQGSSRLTRKPLHRSRRSETSSPVQSHPRKNKMGLTTSTKQNLSMTRTSERKYDSSKYKNTPNSRSYNANQYKSERTLEYNLPGPSQSGSRSPSRSRKTTEETVGRRSPVEGGRFTSTAERVVRLEERDRYRQLVAQFTNIGTPDRTDRTGNRTVLDEPLYVETDFLTKTRSYTRSGSGSLLSPRSTLVSPPVSFTIPASPPLSATRLKVTASPRRSANRSRKVTTDVSLYSRPGTTNISPPNSITRSSNRTLDTSDIRNPFDEDWTTRWRNLLSEDSLARQREISKEEKKLKAIKQKREEETQAIKDKIKERLRRRNLGLDEDEEEEAEEEVEEITDSFVPLTDEMERMVDAALAPGYSEDPLVEGFRVTLKRSDVATLSNLNWLNDEIINFFFNLIMERSNQQGNVKVHAFNSFFYPKLIKSGYASLKRWTKKVDIFAMDVVLVPIHLGMHWCLAVIDFNRKCISYYDSLKGSNPQCLSALSDYLKNESLDKKKVPFDSTGWRTVSPKDIPEQLNGCDCGVFACKYAEYLSRRAPFDFDQRHMPYFRRRMVYEILTKKLL